jgi:hypothetical protein
MLVLASIANLFPGQLLSDPETQGFPFAFASAVAVSLTRELSHRGVWLKSGAHNN